MISANSAQKQNCKCRGASLVVAAFFVSACASTGPSSTPAHIEIQEAVGFTITEKAHISNNVRTEYEDALALIEQGNPDQGVAKLEAVVEAAPHLSAPSIDLGVAYHRAGNLEAAETNLLLALEANPNHPIAHNELGIVYRKVGRFAEARQSYEAALEIYPGYHYARRNLAVLCDLYLADLNCALDNYEAYMATVPGDEEASIWIADIRMRMGQSEE
ncbi:MAG: tetratricopeptide repeat protein [Gammaproteobacteria bacterium]|nr:tetratricopeptide repeat protein [Gammaproteobacteria bacterium]MDH3767158.1 tetratricopeptide repeat protein [Gammaproteobacteria bacterium]